MSGLRTGALGTGESILKPLHFCWRSSIAIGSVAAAGVAVLVDTWGGPLLLAVIIVTFYAIACRVPALPNHRREIFVVGLLPWTTVVGASVIHLPLAYVFVYPKEMGGSIVMICVLSSVATATILCFWNGFIGARVSVVVECVVLLEMLVLWPFHYGYSWYAISVAEFLLLLLSNAQNQKCVEESLK